MCEDKNFIESYEHYSKKPLYEAELCGEKMLLARKDYTCIQASKHKALYVNNLAALVQVVAKTLEANVDTSAAYKGNMAFKTSAIAVAVAPNGDTQVRYCSLPICGIDASHARGGIDYVVAVPDKKPFPYDQWLAQDDFIIACQRHFTMCDKLRAILNACGKVSIRETMHRRDDGVVGDTELVITQGIEKLEATIVNPVELLVEESFPEVGPSSVQVIFRVRFDSERTAFFKFCAVDNVALRAEIAKKIKVWLTKGLAEAKCGAVAVL